MTSHFLDTASDVPPHSRHPLSQALRTPVWEPVISIWVHDSNPGKEMRSVVRERQRHRQRNTATMRDLRVATVKQLATLYLGYPMP